jgi:hypothetical protein
MPGGKGMLCRSIAFDDSHDFWLYLVECMGRLERSAKIAEDGR